MPTLNKNALQVLVAEDNPINQRIAIAALVHLGHRGVIVGDGEKAIRCLAQRSFDVVLMDVSMPHMDGMQALAVIREEERSTGKRIPVVIATAHDLPGDRERFIAAGADGYVAKPIDFERLQSEFSRVLKSS